MRAIDYEKWLSIAKKFSKIKDEAEDLLQNCLLVAIEADRLNLEKELKPISFYVGTFEGESKSPLGPYKETITGEWALDKTAIIVQSKCTAFDMIVFEDIRIFTYDRKNKEIRARQFAMGDLAIYDVIIKDKCKTILLEETSHEGNIRNEWRYTITVTDKDEFSYVADAKDKDEFKKYVGGSLKRQIEKPKE